MRSSIMTLAVALAAGTAAVAGGPGCSKRRDPEPMPRSRVVERPPPVPLRERDERKPLPDRAQGSQVPPPPFDDVPLVSQQPPEQRAFVEAYEAVGRPRILVFVNRTLEGEIVPVNPEDPYVSVERSRTSRGDVRLENRDTRRRDDFYRGRDDRDTESSYESRGPAEVRDRVDVYLRPGEYDEVEARALDYEAMENILADWLASDGRVEIVSPVMARQRLTDEQVKDLQEGRPRAMGEIAKQLDADVLIQLQARPTRQTPRGLEVRVIGEAINVGRGGQSIARAVVEVPPPLDKPQLNKYTRFLARKLMDGMTGSWHAMAESGRGAPATRDDDNNARDRDRDTDRNPPSRDDRPILDDRNDTRRLNPTTGAGSERFTPRDPASRDMIDRSDDAAAGTQPGAAGTRPAPTTRPSAPPEDDAPPAGERPGVPPGGDRQ